MIMIQSERKKFWLFKRGVAENSNKEKIFVLFLLWLSRIVTPSSVCNAEAAEAQGTRALGRRKGRTLPGLSLLFSSAFVSTSQGTKTQSSAPNLHFFPGLGNLWRATGTWERRAFSPCDPEASFMLLPAIHHRGNPPSMACWAERLSLCSNKSRLD